MWSRLSIRLQLIIVLVTTITVIEMATLSAVLNIQEKESQKNSITDAKNIAKSLHNDLLKATLNSNIDLFADISFRLSAFKKINSLVVYDTNHKSIYKFGEMDNISKYKEKIDKQKNIFTPESLFILQNISSDGYTYGYTIIDLDMTEYNQKHDQLTNTILLIFSFALLLGFIISIYVSKSYIRPFSQLLDAMKTSDPTRSNFNEITTDANNEIKELFNGFNNAMRQIFISSQKLVFQAEHDQLTGLKNRFYVENQLKEILKLDTTKQYAILSIDIDQFKLINDSVGLQAGDELLKMIVLEYETTLPVDSIFARVDGDEFMVILKETNLDKATKILHKSLKRLEDFRFVWEGKPLSVSASIGMVMFKPFEYTLEELIKRAHYSIYTAKSKGTNKSHIFKEGSDISKRYDQENITANYIKEALTNGKSRFELFAQELKPLQTNESKLNYEILIRMWDSEGNFVAPDEFLPTAQRYQLMVQIDIFVLWTYLETIMKNRSHIDKLHRVHINLSGGSLNSIDFQNKIKEAVNTFDFPWEKLELEITETSAVGNFTKANEFIKWLKSKNIGLALDDFGTGMASFEYLKHLPFDIVKIDGSFIQNMHIDPSDKAVIKYIQEIANLKGQETVAEYVETKEVFEELKQMGITYAQGYYIGKPQELKNYF